MSNDDLRKVNNRDSLERTYKKNNSKITKIMAIVGATAGTVGSVSAIMKNTPEIMSTGKRVTKKVVSIPAKMIRK